ncbi:hypothetical protein AB6G29_09095 [Providencia hangzhouensis]|uniref:hypothetical protein n=1 Tax=Providencia hangzhouensis TaxID=3031799 RepID=UPI0034DD1DF5
MSNTMSNSVFTDTGFTDIQGDYLHIKGTHKAQIEGDISKQALEVITNKLTVHW